MLHQLFIEHDASGVCGVLRDVHQARTGDPQHDLLGVQVRRTGGGIKAQTGKRGGGGRGVVALCTAFDYVSLGGTQHFFRRRHGSRWTVALLFSFLPKAAQKGVYPILSTANIRPGMRLLTWSSGTEKHIVTVRPQGG